MSVEVTSPRAWVGVSAYSTELLCRVVIGERSQSRTARYPWQATLSPCRATSLAPASEVRILPTSAARRGRTTCNRRWSRNLQHRAQCPCSGLGPFSAPIERMAWSVPFDVRLADPLAGCGGAPPPAVDSISRAGYLSCPNDNAVHDRSGHPGGYHNPGWKNAERSGGGRRCLNRLRGHPLDNTVIAIDTRTGAQTVISAEGGTHAVTVDPARHTVVASNTAAGTASVIERR